MKRIRYFTMTICLGLPTIAAATDYFVANCGDNSLCNGLASDCYSGGVAPNCAKKTIQAAVDLAVSDGDIVTVAAGTYTGTGNRDILIDNSGYSITVRCETPNDPTNCVIDGGHTGQCDNQVSQGNQHRGFRISNGVTPSTIIDGFTIKNGCRRGSTPDAYGGAILIDHAAPTIRNCIIEDNKALDGGGIGLVGSSPDNDFLPVIDNCIIRNNAAIRTSSSGDGGGIFAVAHVDPEIVGCTISGNSSNERGGGIFFGIGCDMNIADSVIENNTARIGGGGIYMEQVKEGSDVFPGPKILNSRIGPGNSTSASCCAGGGIRINGIWSGNTAPVKVYIANTTIIENHADASQGGGVAITGGNVDAILSLFVINSVIAGNTAQSGGGVYVKDFTPTTLSNVTMMHNRALSSAGGSAVFFEGTEVSNMDNTVVWYDANPPAQSQVRKNGSDNLLRVSYSDIQDSLPSGVLGISNISSNPGFVDLDGVDNDPDTLIDNDYRLTAGSPCNDRGSNLLVLADDLDLDGDSDFDELVPGDGDNFERFADDPAASDLGVNTAAYPFYVDMGAYEFGGCPVAGIPPALEAPFPDSIARNRYVSFQPGNPGETIGIRVRMVDLVTANAQFVDFHGQTRWVGAPVQISFASMSESFWAAPLQCDPYYATWASSETLHVFGTEIVPGATYLIEVFHDQEECPTAGVMIQTARYGDIVGPSSGPPDDKTDLLDVNAGVVVFQQSAGAVSRTRAKLSPNLPDPGHHPNLADINQVVKAFQSLPYPLIGPIDCP